MTGVSRTQAHTRTHTHTSPRHPPAHTHRARTRTQHVRFTGARQGAHTHTHKHTHDTRAHTHTYTRHAHTTHRRCETRAAAKPRVKAPARAGTPSTQGGCTPHAAPPGIHCGRRTRCEPRRCSCVGCRRRGTAALPVWGGGEAGGIGEEKKRKRKGTRR